jgi:hypothetical protein
MKVIYSKIGGMVATIGRIQFCIFPANVRFAKSPQCIVLFGVGFSYGIA